MTARKVLLYRSNEGAEGVSYVYVSWHPPIRSLIATVLTDGDHSTEPVASLEQAHQTTCERLLADGCTIVADVPWTRSKVQAERMNGLLHLVHQDEAIMLTEEGVRAAIDANPPDQARWFVENLRTNFPAAVAVVERWAADSTVQWQAIEHLRYLLDHQSEDEVPQEDVVGLPDVAGLPDGVVEAASIDWKKAARCPVCGIGVLPSGRGEPIAVNKHGQPMCRRHGRESVPGYGDVLDAYLEWRSARAQGLFAVKKDG